MHGETQQNKVFVGGLPKAMPDEEVRLYFEKFGEIQEVDIKVDPGTTNSRGFGFVTFKDESAAVECLKLYDTHQVGGKWVEVKAAVLGGGQGDNLKSQPCTFSIFIFKISSKVLEIRFKQNK